jgi:hypothetical protein
LVSIGGNAALSNNRAGDDGGGVHLYGGHMNLFGKALINGNSAPCGAGICIEIGAMLELAESPVISDNKTSGGHGTGGGLCVGISGTIVMRGGFVRGNEADMGAGVYIESGRFIMEAGRIKSNRAQHGGGVYAASGTFQNTGGTVIKNTPDN